MKNLERRNFLKILVATSSLVPISANPAAAFWPALIRLFISGSVRRVLPRVLRSQKTRSAAGIGITGGTQLRSRTAKAISRSGGRKSTVNYASGSKSIRNMEKIDIRRSIVREIAIETGLQLVLPESLDFTLDGVAGLTAERARQVQEFGAKAVWVVDEPNHVDVMGRNLLSERVIDWLNVELWDLETNQKLGEPERGWINIASDGELHRERFTFYNIPSAGPKEIQAYLEDNPAVTLRQKAESIIAVYPHEIVRWKS